jgi:putative sterol carrier protein
LAYFERAQDVYETIGKLFASLVSGDDDLSASFLGADTIVRYRYTDPDAVITVSLLPGKGGVEFGESELEAEVVMSMSADIAHRFWLGEVNVTTALARGEIRAEGPVAKLLKLVPLAKPAFPRYRQLLIDQGRSELATL